MAEKNKYPFRKYFWLVPNPTTGRMRRTRYRLSELEAMQYPGAVRIEQDSLLIDGPLEVLPSPFKYR